MPIGVYSRGSSIERFLNYIAINENGCWEWTGFLYPSGYGCFQINGSSTRSHRFAYEWFNQCKLPNYKLTNLQLDHLCRNRKCVNPDHLELVTARENVQRGSRSLANIPKKTCCLRGHLYSDKTTFIDYKGYTKCRECKKIYDKKYRQKGDLRNDL